MKYLIRSVGALAELLSVIVVMIVIVAIMAGLVLSASWLAGFDLHWIFR